ncbi:XRE family transcriptional regulator [Chromobacterium aquaticum]|uniref:XRE family transcriptional regulator n=1 Tax=Chromobacterium aquaticum TaxID=467180 RepID=A0ABV8ZZJ7_9NEIS|nr:XRE family transcriptional regulator [Chromobacterium aquaticum]MCD5362767.1 XRE family transcriptional regulator [Chromobacterium aquaticum]
MKTSETRTHWLDLLRAEAERTSMRSVAARLGYSLTTISLVLSGKYPGRPDKIAKAVIELLEQAVACPYLGQTIAADLCRSHATGPAPTHNPLKMAHWRACQQCQNRRKGD